MKQHFIDIVKLAGPEATHAEESFWGIVTNLRESEAKARKLQLMEAQNTQTP